MDDYDDIQKSVLRIADSIRAQIRDEYRYIKATPLDAILSRCKIEIMAGILAQQPIMAASKDRMNFMSLPDDVRARIYWLAMKPDPNNKEDQEKYNWDTGKPAIVLQTEYADKYSWDPDWDFRGMLQPALTKVSRQVRRECLRIWYSNIEFRASGCGYVEQIETAASRLSRIGKYQRIIKHLRVLYDDDDLEDNVKKETISLFHPVPASSIKIMVLSNKKAGASVNKFTIAGRRSTYEEI